MIPEAINSMEISSFDSNLIVKQPAMKVTNAMEKKMVIKFLSNGIFDGLLEIEWLIIGAI